MTQLHRKLFRLEQDSLPDITCGACTDQVKGVKRVQIFRPTHFTAEWTNGVLAEVRVWGPRVFCDGSLGERELDYRWKKTRAAGPVKYTDLPLAVVGRLRSYNTEHSFKELPEQL
jgi:hypothetical protein